MTYEGKPITAVDILQILFIALKLTHMIDWSWWFVLAPTIIVIAFLVFVAAVKAAR